MRAVPLERHTGTLQNGIHPCKHDERVPTSQPSGDGFGVSALQKKHIDLRIAVVYELAMDRSDVVDVARARRMASSGEAKAIREEAGLSLSELAGGIPVVTTTLWKWETGRSRPRPDAAVRWIQILDDLAAESGRG